MTQKATQQARHIPRRYHLQLAVCDLVHHPLHRHQQLQQDADVEEEKLQKNKKMRKRENI